MRQILRIAQPREAVWLAVRDPVLLASCVPGALLTRSDADALEGEIAVALGPITANFVGNGRIDYGSDYSGRLAGHGRDSASGTRLVGEAVFRLVDDGPETEITLDISYSLRGPLAQFGRGTIVSGLAREMAQLVAANLGLKLSGAGSTDRLQPARLRLAPLLRRRLWRWLARLFG
jgi:carbon-monoxide dehydrogenase small subunit